MAKLPALVAALTECDDRDRATLDWVARAIREAGCIPTGKRGAGAADMTFREAANLLIGANAAETPKQSALAVVQFRTLRPTDLSPQREKEGVFARIDEAETFGEALEALIEGSPELLVSLMQYVDDAYSGHNEEQRRLLKGRLLSGDLAKVEVAFSRPNPFAWIKVSTSPFGSETTEYHWVFAQEVSLLREGFYPQVESDRVTTVTIGIRTLLKLCAAVVGDEGGEGAKG